MAIAPQVTLMSTKNDDAPVPSKLAPPRPAQIEVGLLTGCRDWHYAWGLAMALNAKGTCLEIIGGEGGDSPEMRITPGLSFLNLLGSYSPDAGLTKKTLKLLRYYARLIRYASVARPKVFHILWNNKFELFDRTLLMLHYKLFGKKIVFTAHNINAGKRDGNDSPLNRLSLKIQFQLADHIFVHTEKMKDELVLDFGVRRERVTAIPFAINNPVRNTDLTPAEAKRRLGVGSADRAILFFGRIRPYKGLEHLVAAFQLLAPKHPAYRLIIAGESKRGSEWYWREIEEAIDRGGIRGRVTQRIGFVPDSETELYFKAADVLVLPYKFIFQSGVLFLGYSFGVPVIVSDVGSLREDVIEEKTGFVCRACDPADLARAIETYFDSSLFRNLDSQRQEIRDYAKRKHSWDIVAEKTREVYARLLENPPTRDPPSR